jgi:hypothetical protein
LEVVTVCPFVLCLSVIVSFGSNPEVMNSHGVEKKEVNNKRESENYSDGGKESYCVTK